MLYTIFVTLFILMSFLLILLILVQKTKSSLGLGNIGGGSQILFGGSGGQEFFQKLTWLLGGLFIIGSLYLSIQKTRNAQSFRYLKEVSKQQEPLMQPEPITSSVE